MRSTSKNYLLKTLLAVVLMAVGAWGFHLGGRINAILGGSLFVLGFVIMLVLYGKDWLQWW